VQDILLAPVSDILIDRAKPKAGERIVDVGCGCGATTIAFAQKVGPDRTCFRPSTFRHRCWLGRGKSRQRGCSVDFVACGRNRIPIRCSKPRSHGVALRRDVSSAEPAVFLCQYAESAASIWKADIRLLARATRYPWLMLPLQAAYQHVPKLPQLGPEDPRSVLICFRIQRVAAHIGRGRIFRDRNAAVRSVARCRNRARPWCRC